MCQILATKSVFARYFTNSQLLISSNKEGCNGTEIDDCMLGWWHCVKTDSIYLDRLSAKQRYRIKKGLKFNKIKIATYEELNECIAEIVDMLIDSYSDYPSIYKPTCDINKYAKELIDSVKRDDTDIWLVKDKDSCKLVGLSYCVRVEDVINLKVVKVRPSYLKNEVNAALGYLICRYYMNGLGMRYICDGERNIRHITNYQDFLIKVLGFKKAYCKLHVVYHPLVRPIVNMLYPFRRLISKIGRWNRYLYDVSCLLRQEEIVRNSS